MTVLHSTSVCLRGRAIARSSCVYITVIIVDGIVGNDGNDVALHSIFENFEIRVGRAIARGAASIPSGRYM